MNEKAINTVISDYAIENANLKIQVATLSAEMNELKASMVKEEEPVQPELETEEK